MTAAVMDTEQRRGAGLVGHDSDGYEHDGSHNAPSMSFTDRGVGVAVSADLVFQAAEPVAARAMRTVAAGPEVIVRPGALVGCAADTLAAELLLIRTAARVGIGGRPVVHIDAAIAYLALVERI